MTFKLANGPDDVVLRQAGSVRDARLRRSAMRSRASRNSTYQTAAALTPTFAFVQSTKSLYSDQRFAVVALGLGFGAARSADDRLYGRQRSVALERSVHAASPGNRISEDDCQAPSIGTND